jgi:FkbM family methyltransferase
MLNLTGCEFYDAFTNNYCAAKKYIFGINPYADAVASVAEVDGYIDQYTSEVSYQSKPVVKLEDIPKDSLIVSTVTNSRPKTAIQKIRSAGLINCIDYFAFADASNGKVLQLDCIRAMREDFAENNQTYQWIRSLLHDEESVTTFDSVMDFRLNAKLQALDRFNFRVDQQYFEPFLNLAGGEVFVDGGGYDGFTTKEFVKRCSNYGAVHFFEPSESNILLAKKNMRSLGNINYHQLGLYDAKTTLSFDAGDGSSSRITDNGTEKINVDALDRVVHEKVSFIKLDLEGAEMPSLRGMRQHILNDHPKLAVAIYHQPSDFREIPAYILGLRKDYDVYLRHYTEGWAETIMFFIPKK